MIQLLRRNLGYKILSLCIGIMLYAIAFTQNNPRVTREMFVTPESIELRNLPNDMVIRTGPVGFQVSVQGQLTAIEAFRSQSVKAYVDLTRAAKGKYRAPLRYRVDNALVDIVGPTFAEIDIARKARMTFAVDTLFNNTPPPGYAYEEPTTKPPSVQVTGLESEVRKVDRVVAVIDNESSNSPLNQETYEVYLVAQTVKQESVDTVDIIPSRVVATLRLKKAPAIKSLVLSPQLQGAPASGYALTGIIFDPPTINVNGPQTELAKLSSITVPIDVSGINASETRSVKVDLPNGLMRAGQGSNRVSVRLEVVRTRTQLPPPETEGAAPVTAPTSTPAPVGTPSPKPETP